MEGPTMGTQYKIIIKSDQDVNPDMVQNQIERILWVINNQMSTYDPKSEISTFNSEFAIPDINSTFLDPEQAKKKENLQKEQPNHSSTISEHFSNVIEKSFYYYEVSDGMFDITVHPLYELWGFQGKSENLKIEPSKKEVDIALDFVGMDKLKYSRGNQLLYKNSNQISIDVNAIAKGYAVDVISDYIEDQGYLVLDREPSKKERIENPKIVTFTSKVSYQSFRTNLDEEVSVWLQKAIERAFEIKPILIRMSGGSIPISPFVNELNIPAVTVPTVNRDNNQHSPNENIRLGNYKDGIKTILAVLTEKL